MKAMIATPTLGAARSRRHRGVVTASITDDDLQDDKPGLDGHIDFETGSLTLDAMPAKR